MKIGILKDIKKGEYRVIATPCEVATLIEDGNEVFVQHDAGSRAGFEDAEYADAGAMILETKEEIYATCDMVAKVKEIEPCEYDLLRENQIIYTCIHPAAHPEELQALLDHKVIAFTAEDTHRHGSPNCEAAGKAGAFMGLYAMMSTNGGCGKFVSGLGAAPNVRAMVLGCGTVGMAAIDTLYRMGAWVSVGATPPSSPTATTFRSSCRRWIWWSTVSAGPRMPRSSSSTARWFSPCTRAPSSWTSPMTTASSRPSIPPLMRIPCISRKALSTTAWTTFPVPSPVPPPWPMQPLSCPISAASRKTVWPRPVPGDGFLRRGLTAYKGYLTHEESSCIQDRPWVRPEVILDIADRKLDSAPPATRSRSEQFYEEFAGRC